jgi:hypothetical protein
VTRRPYLQTGAVFVRSSKNTGSGARYTLQTFHETVEMVNRQFGESLAQAFTRRQEALDFLHEVNIVDSVMNS